MRAVGGAGKEPSRRKPTGGLPPPYEPPAEARHWRAGQTCGRGDDCRFVPPDPPHSALALLAIDCGECG